MIKRSIETKKQLGAFYTPSEATKILCDWAIQSPADLILEPSFGGCGFIDASFEKLTSIGCKSPEGQVFGCDIDEVAFHHLSDIIGSTISENQFIYADFLKLRSSAFSGNRFDVIIGNPPYISNHNMSEEQKIAAMEAIKAGGLSLDKKASLWAYFVLHSLSFLKENARMAWILPASFLNADYSTNVKEILFSKFKNVLMISLGERLFLSEGADESTVILLCDKHHLNTFGGSINYSYASSLQELNNILMSWSSGLLASCDNSARPSLALIGNEASQYFNLIKNNRNTVRFGAFAKILIGIVTGANNFFVINKSTANKNNLQSSYLTPIFSKFNISSGVMLGDHDIDQAIARDKKCLLVDTTKVLSLDGELRDYLETFPADDILTNQTFKKRTIWHRPDDGRLPDAFLPYMIHAGPILVLNEAHITSTNTIHRVFFNSDISSLQIKLIAISMLSTFSQLSAEIEGRTYGSGVLKLEPKEASNILMHIPDGITENDANRTLELIDNFMKLGDLDKVQQAADSLMLRSFGDVYGPDIFNSLSNTLQMARSRRRKSRVK